MQVDAALLATAAWSLAIFGVTGHPLHGELMRRLRGMHPADFDALALNSLFQARRTSRRKLGLGYDDGSAHGDLARAAHGPVLQEWALYRGCNGAGCAPVARRAVRSGRAARTSASASLTPAHFQTDFRSECYLPKSTSAEALSFRCHAS